MKKLSFFRFKPPPLKLTPVVQLPSQPRRPRLKTPGVTVVWTGCQLAPFPVLLHEPDTPRDQWQGD